MFELFIRDKSRPGTLPERSLSRGSLSVGLLIETNLLDHNAMVEVLHDLIERVPVPPEQHHQLEIRL